MTPHNKDDVTLKAVQPYAKEQSFFNGQPEKKRSAASNRTNRNVQSYLDAYPFVSILIATYNESLVIGNLMTSCSRLTYERSRHEIIIVDDSTDETFSLLKQWENKILNLKLIHRTERTGWKGGALNLALKSMNPKSSYVLVVDADNVLVHDTLESFIYYFLHPNSKCTYAIQGFPISTVDPSEYVLNFHNNDNPDKIMKPQSNWVANAIAFRLLQRNIIEFMAKDYLNLPVQITGSLFMIRSEIIKAIGFSDDLTEDWDLTLELNLSPKLRINNFDIGCNDYKQRKKINFNPLLISYSQVTTKIREYLKQRARVSEGHTRGFRKRMWTIVTSTIPLRNKIEFFFVGLHFAKFIAVFALIIINAIFIPLMILWNNGELQPSIFLIEISLIVQLSNVLIVIATGIISIFISNYFQPYSKKNVFYLLLLNLVSIPALVLGSALGFCRNKGRFYRTKRNILH